MDARKWFVRLSRAACIGGAVLLAVGMLLTTANVPVRAQEETPQGLETEEIPVPPEETVENTVEVAPTTEETPVPTEEILSPTEEATLPVEETATPTEEIIDSSQAVESTEATPELSLVCVSTAEDDSLVATLSDGSQMAVVDGLVEGTQIVVVADAPLCEERALDQVMAAASVSYAVSGSKYTMCGAIPDDIHADFVVTVSGLQEGYEGLELYVMDPYGNVTVYPLPYGGGSVVVNDTWPGITDVHSVIWMSWSAYLYDNGSQVADALASVSYDPNMGDTQTCTAALALAAPVCDPGGGERLAWYGYNPNLWAAEYQWFVDGALLGSGWMPPSGGGVAEKYFLGLSVLGNHTAELVWVGIEGKGAVLTGGEELGCVHEETAPQPPEQSFIPSTASEPILEAPVEEGLPILIPVTGADLAPMAAGELFGRLFTSLGLLVGGMGMIMRGWPKR